MYKNILRYSPEIDSLRTIAVFSVILFHFSPEILRGGFLGVDIFFVISGYLMVTIINNQINVYVVSLKEFNYPSKYKILKATNEERSEMYSNYSPNYISIYNTLKKLVNKENLFDLNDYISKFHNNSKLTTSLFDNNGEIISYDGKHLTNHGSKYIAEKIKEKNKFFLENNKNLK